MDLKINNLSRNLFKNKSQSIENKANKSNHTNPFGVSFKGNMLTSDVFEAPQISKRADIIEKVSNRSKMVTSAIVGSINNFSEAMSTRLNSVVSFGRRMKNNAINMWKETNNIHLVLNIKDIKEILNSKISVINYSVGNLKKRAPEELGLMWEKALVKVRV